MRKIKCIKQLSRWVLALVFVAGGGEVLSRTLLAEEPHDQEPESLPIVPIDQPMISVWQGAEFAVQTNPENELHAPLVVKRGPDLQDPDGFATYDIQLTNLEASPRSVWLLDVLPTELHPVLPLESGLTYDPQTHTLGWEGVLPAGHLTYLLEPNGIQLPYLDLAEYGVPSLCSETGGPEETCGKTAVSFDLGINGMVAWLYGQAFHQLTVSADGLVLGGAHSAHPSSSLWLPTSQTDTVLLAGLWRENKVGQNGRFHAAIVQGVLPDYDLFYAQWHDLPHKTNPYATARHAIGIVLGETGPLAGHIFYIYDNVADPLATTDTGFTIGLSDYGGARGLTLAYAGPERSPFGTLPASPTTWQFRPTVLGTQYTQTLSYQARVLTEAPTELLNTAYVATDSPNPRLARQWSTHTLLIRRLAFLPVLLNAERSQ